MEHSVGNPELFNFVFGAVIAIIFLIRHTITNSKRHMGKPHFNEFKPKPESGEAIGYRYGHNVEKWLKVFRVTMTDGTIRWAVLHSDGYLEGPFTEEIIPDQKEAPESGWNKREWEDLTWAKRK